MNSFTIRAATPADLPAILTINSQFIPEVSKVSLQWLQQYLPHAPATYVCENENGVQAFIMAMLGGVDYQSENYQWFQRHHPECLYIDRVAVAAAAQGQGMGKGLYAHLVAEWRGRVRTLACEVNVDLPNPKSYQFHSGLGFYEVGQQDTKQGTIRVAMLLRDL